MVDVYIDPSLIEINLDVKTKEDGITRLGEKLFQKGFVEEGFTDHVLEREKGFPTGLPTSIPVALCHTEAKHVRQSVMAVATLQNPVQFQEMGSPENWLNVEIIFLLAIKDPKDQVPWLRKMVMLFQNHAILKNIRQATSAEDLSQLLKQHLG